LEKVGKNDEENIGNSFGDSHIGYWCFGGSKGRVMYRSKTAPSQRVQLHSGSMTATAGATIGDTKIAGAQWTQSRLVRYGRRLYRETYLVTYWGNGRTDTRLISRTRVG
jgi:hypothetical protein